MNAYALSERLAAAKWMPVSMDATFGDRVNISPLRLSREQIPNPPNGSDQRSGVAFEFFSQVAYMDIERTLRRLGLSVIEGTRKFIPRYDTSR